MNTKKKHKNRPKPNPVSAKPETEVKEEKVEEVLTKIDVVEETPTAATSAPDVPEAITPVVKSAETESETPKKPKRNKGKKKHQDSDNVEEDTQDKVQDIIPSESLKTEQQVSAGDDIKNVYENKSTEAATVTPSARKKKNKKKSQDQVTQQTKLPEKECLPIAAEEKEAEILNVDPEIKEVVPPKVEDIKPDTKSKKKNKKKKRTDSEKSDKSEEVTCTSAFQQLLIEEDKSLKEQEANIEDTLTELTTGSSTLSESKIAEEVPKICNVETTEEPSIQTQEVLQLFKEDSKTKKKNKKDKKHPPEEQLSETAQKETIPKIEQVMKLIEPFKTNIEKEPSPKPEVKQDVEFLEPLKSQAIREPSPKPKAKIAKPVEKKKKGQNDDSETESPIKTTSQTENLAATKDEEPIEKPVTPAGNPEIFAEETLKEAEPLIKPQNILPMVDTINLPDTKLHDKKRKKSPKPPKSKEKTEVKQDSSEKLIESTEVKSDLSITAEEKVSSASENVIFTMTEPSILLQNPEKTETNSPIDEIPPLVKIDETDFTENKTGKRKKKTPKFPVPSEVTDTKDTKQVIFSEEKETKDISKTGESSKVEKESESLAAPLSDVDIQSLKTDESGSSCDATPDIHFIRSSSHQLLDSNNNMAIHEVRNVEETKPNEPCVKPLVEGSGETPSGTPDLISSDIKMTRSKTSGKQEPTYIKSKMIEVNRDMEDLRLSIERSLAEFTAMEKTEQKAEKDYESHRLECEKTFADIQVAKAVTPEVDITLPVQLEKKSSESLNITEAPPVCPARKDNKGKSKSKKKGKQEMTTGVSSTSQCETTSTDSKDSKDKQETKEKTEQKTESTDNKGKQQSESIGTKDKQCDATEQPTMHENLNASILEHTFSDSLEQLDYAPIENFEDAMTSSIDDVNKSFEMIVSNNAEESQKNLAANKPEINVTAPVEETESTKKDTNKRDEKINPVSQPKNFLGHNDIPAQSNKTDYKKEKNKTPNERQAKVKIKDAMDVEAKKQSKESQTDIKRAKKMIDKSEKETFSRVKNDNEEYVYKYSFRKVFLQSACHVCHKELKVRVPCSYCNLVFYCDAKHKDEDWTHHQALCFAVSTIVHLKDQKHIYADAQNITGQEYRLLRMQMIVSCEKVLKRRLVPWEQEAMLYPRMCGDVSCREWRQSKLKDCDGCGQISYCADQPNHLPKSHQRWCKSYHLYSKLVGYQQTHGRLEPRLPTKVIANERLAEKMNEVLASMYEEKIDMNDIQYAALTQLATAPLTAAYCYQLCMSKTNHCNGLHKKTFTIHVVGAELQFEADALNKWEVFFLHLRPDIEELRVVLISPALNPGDLPLDLLGKIRLCDNCRQNKRRVVFSFQDKKNYSEYRSSEEFVSPKLVCAFNPSIQRSSVYNGKDPWPNTINCIIKQKVPFIITGYTLTELRKDIARIKECSEVDFRVISEPVFNNFASVRPDRNFISDDEMPLLFKNYCVSVLCGY